MGLGRAHYGGVGAWDDEAAGAAGGQGWGAAGGGEELGRDELGNEVSTSLEPLGLGMTPPPAAYAKT